MTKVREAEGSSIHRKQSSCYTSTEKLLLNTKEHTLKNQSVRSAKDQLLMISMQNTEKQNVLEQNKTMFHFAKTCSNSENLQQTNQGHTGV